MPEHALPPTVERTLRLVEMLLAQPDGLAPQDFLVELDMSRSSLFLMLRSMKALGYVEQAEKRGRYRLGPRLEAWRASPSLASQDLLTAFYQETARKPWLETLALVVQSSDGPVILAQVEGSRQVRSTFTPGQIYPALHAAAALLQATPTGAVEALGYALVEGTDSLDLALPVCRDGRHPDAVLLLSAPSYRWSQQKLLDAFLSDLRAMAARLSYQLGAALYAPFAEQSESWTTPAQPLSQEEMNLFLLGPWAARLACIRPDGLPHVIPVWQEWDGETFSLVAWKGSFWGEYVLQNPNISLSVDEPWPPLRRVVARGQARPFTLEETQSKLATLLQRLTLRYLGGTKDLRDRAGVVFTVKLSYLRGWQGTPWQPET